MIPMLSISRLALRHRQPLRIRSPAMHTLGIQGPCSALLMVRVRRMGSTAADEGTRITLLGLASNVALTAGKGVGGIMWGSASLLADAVHSLSDLVGDFVTLFTYRNARAERNTTYPYGHGKLEPLGSLSISALLFGAGLGTGYHSIHLLQSMLSDTSKVSLSIDAAASPETSHLLSDPATAAIALTLAVSSIAIKELLFHWTLHVGQKQNSSVLVANAWHHRADSASGFVALCGVAGAWAGVAWLDPVGGILVSGLIVQSAWKMAVPAIGELRDTADTQVINQVQKLLQEFQQQDHNITGFHSIRARKMGPETLVDLQLRVKPRISVSLAHQIAENARHAICTQVSDVSEVLIHVDVERHDHGAIPVATDIPTSALEEEIVAFALDGFPPGVLKRVSHLKVHFLNGGMELDAEIVLDQVNSLSFLEAVDVAKSVKQRLLLFPGVIAADVHLETTDHGGDCFATRRWRREERFMDSAAKIE
ncbi:cation efflux family-domain-containing protein [Chytriomyces cf. hyalinus JEL632]|nr:cation efflux family-domain-containing protein [Chytriomyces cf. hyalinus JEL632]